MGWNPSAPAILGSELRFTRRRVHQIASQLEAVVTQLRSPGSAAPPPAAVHVPLIGSIGSAGFSVEVLPMSSAVPQIDDPHHVAAGTTTGAVTAGWETHAGSTSAANLLAALANPDDLTTYVRNIGPETHLAPRPLSYRGSESALSGKRVVAVWVGCVARHMPISGTNPLAAFLTARLRAGGSVIAQTLPTAAAGIVPTDGTWRTYRLAADAATGWTAHPSTGLPWTLAQLNAFLTSTSDFGVVTHSWLAAQALQIAGLWLEVLVCDDTRIGHYYETGPTRNGWQRYALTDTDDFPDTDDDWCALVMTAITTGAGFAGVPISGTNQDLRLATTPGGLGEHRRSWRGRLVAPGGPLDQLQPHAPGDVPAFLIEDANGDIIDQSQPYPGLNGWVSVLFAGETLRRVYGSGNMPYLRVDRVLPDETGQSITTTDATTYVAVRVPVGWWNQSRRPDAPLIIELWDAITGGTMLTSTVVNPDDIDADVRDRYLPWDAPVALDAATQYYVRFRSDATGFSGGNLDPGARGDNVGWRIPMSDTRSGLIPSSSATTPAQVIGASIGGEDDAFFRDGELPGGNARYDIALALIAAPEPPELTATVVDGIPGKVAPHVLCEITPPDLGAGWGGYRLYRRPSRIGGDWHLIFEELPRPGYDPAVQEVEHATFACFTSGWTYRAAWADGWDFAASYIDVETGDESDLAVVTRVVVPAECPESWIASDHVPYLNSPAVLYLPVSVDQDDRAQVHHVRGEAFATVTRPAETPARELRTEVQWSAPVGPETIRMLRAAAQAAHPFAVLQPLGEWQVGTLHLPGSLNPQGGLLRAEVRSVETGVKRPAPHNLACGLRCDDGGLEIAHHVDVDPGSEPWTVALAVAPTALGDQTLVTKEDAGDGWSIEIDDGALVATLAGSSATATLSAPVAGLDDGDIHVIILSTDGASQSLLVDGVVVDTDTVAHGAVSTTEPVSVSVDGLFHAFGVWGRVLEGREVDGLVGYLRAWPDSRPAAAPVMWVDARDRRSWTGREDRLRDISRGHDATVVGTPATRGVPWTLTEREVDR